MLYNLCLHLHGISTAAALTAATIFVLIAIAKEKRDGRKGA